MAVANLDKMTKNYPSFKSAMFIKSTGSKFGNIGGKCTRVIRVIDN